ALPAPAADEFYHSDLIGLAVVHVDGRQLGQVIAVHNHGAGDLLEVAPLADASGWLPFHAAAVPAVDLTAGVITVDPPLGLLPGDPETA
ncbi:MAG: PRC-barrel domain-containing protein, partial [Pseudomonadota bacterium]|nr:PRC-barrel domain-containing protein [Pseudomonadota bacterium]